MRTLGARGLLAPLREAISSGGTPLLGICLGLAGAVRRQRRSARTIPASAFSRDTWPRCRRRPSCRTWDGTSSAGCALRCCWKAFRADAYFYFAHSYAALDAGECGRGHVRSRRAVCGRARAREPFRRAVSSREIGRRGGAGACEFRGLRRREEQRMTLARRIIPCLDTDGERVVKGVQFCQFARCRRSRGAGGALQPAKAPTNWWCWISPPRAIIGPRFSKRFAASPPNWPFRSPPAAAWPTWTRAAPSCAPARTSSR